MPKVTHKQAARNWARRQRQKLVHLEEENSNLREENIFLQKKYKKYKARYRSLAKSRAVLSTVTSTTVPPAEAIVPQVSDHCDELDLESFLLENKTNPKEFSIPNLRLPRLRQTIPPTLGTKSSIAKILPTQGNKTSSSEFLKSSKPVSSLDTKTSSSSNSLNPNSDKIFAF